MHAVGLHFECEVGAVVENEGHPVGAAHVYGESGPVDQGPGVQFLLPQLHDVDAASDAGLEELLEVGSVARAEVEAAVAEWGGHPPATARTSSRRSPSTSTVVAVSLRGTGSPLRSTTTHLAPRPSRARRSSRVAPSSRSI